MKDFRVSVVLTVALLMLLAGIVLGGVAIVQNSVSAASNSVPKPSATTITIYVDGREFRANDVTTTAYGIQIVGFWERSGNQWVYRPSEGLQIHGDYTLRQPMVNKLGVP